jgi:vacuolar-type H+-ATPase subunit C/Vma6
MTTWVDVVARTRGLATRLLTPAQVAELALAQDLRDLALRLASARSQPVPERAPDPVSMELEERRRAGAQIRLLARWCGPRVDRLAPLLEDEDCRSIRAAVRGSSGGMPVAERLAGLVPTPSLPERALAQLVAASDLPTIAALLAVWGSPYAAPVLAQSARQHPDLFALEHELVRAWVERARRPAGRAGRAMTRFVSRSVDRANCWSALLVVEHGMDGDPAALFLDGGELVPQDAFVRAATAPDRRTATAILDPLVRQSPLAAATSTLPGAGERVRRALALEQRDLARREPLGLAPIIGYWLRLRGEVDAVQRLVWGIAVGASSDRRLVVSS